MSLVFTFESLAKYLRFNSPSFYDYAYSNITNLSAAIKTTDFCKGNANKLNNDNYCLIVGAIHTLTIALYRSKDDAAAKTLLANFDI